MALGLELTVLLKIVYFVGNANFVTDHVSSSSLRPTRKLKNQIYRTCIGPCMHFMACSKEPQL